MIISKEFDEKSSSLIASYFDSNGNIAFIKKPIPKADQFNWVTTTNPTEFRNWDDRFLRKAPTKWPSGFRLEELIQSRLTNAEKSALYSENHPKRTFLDIEIKLESQDFPEPSKALMEVNLITFVGENNVVFTLSTTEDFDKNAKSQMINEVNEYLLKSKINTKFTLNYIYFEEEIDMLTFFFHKCLPRMSFLTGWNVIGFDWLYLINRAKRLKIEPMKYMPSNKLIGKSQMPLHLGLLDYMEVFMNTKPYKVVENYKLDYISELVLGITKLKTDYSTMLEAQQDTFNFAKYNIIDTCLVKLIDDKLELLDVAFAISIIANIEVSRIFSAVFITEMLMCREFLENGKFLANDKRDLDEDSTYAGAYVMKPIPGYYKYIMLDDFASMYPNLTIQFNMSSDVYLGKIQNINDPIPDNIIFTKNNTLFSNNKDSVARVILTRLYQKRVNIKTEMAKLELLLDEIKI